MHWHGTLDGWRLAMIAAAGFGAAFVARVWRLVDPAPTPEPLPTRIRVPDSPAELFRPDLPPAPTPRRTSLGRG